VSITCWVDWAVSFMCIMYISICNYCIQKIVFVVFVSTPLLCHTAPCSPPVVCSCCLWWKGSGGGSAEFLLSLAQSSRQNHEIATSALQPGHNRTMNRYADIHGLLSKDTLNWSKVNSFALLKRFIFLINAVYFYFKFIEKSRNKIFHDFHKNTKQHNCFQHRK